MEYKWRMHSWRFSLAFLFLVGHLVASPPSGVLSIGHVEGIDIHSIKVYDDLTNTLPDSGNSIDLWVQTSQNYSYGPLVFWTSPNLKIPIYVESLSAMNYVLRDLYKAHGDIDDSVYHIIGMVAHQYPAEGSVTGWTLSESNRPLLLRGLKNGLSKERFEFLSEKLSPYRFVKTQSGWSAEWVEVDRLGGAEKVTVVGTLSPLLIKSVLREVVLAEGSIPVNLLNLRYLYTGTNLQTSGDVSK